jgi:hypothetical protein
MKNSPASFDTDAQGQALAVRLNQACNKVSHDISERLRIARSLALQARPAPLRQLQRVHHLQAHGTLTSPTEDGLNLWHILGSGLPLLALVAGLSLIQAAQHDRLAADMAITDSALLLDELPPDAYADPGFLQFLKLQMNQRPPHD